MDVNLKTRIISDPSVLAGKPTVRGLRISVEHVLQAIDAGILSDELLADYPDLEPDDLRACVAYAATLVADEVEIPESHREELDHRLDEADANPAAGLAWEEVRKRL